MQIVVHVDVNCVNSANIFAVVARVCSCLCSLLVFNVPFVSTGNRLCGHEFQTPSQWTCSVQALGAVKSK